MNAGRNCGALRGLFRRLLRVQGDDDVILADPHDVAVLQADSGRCALAQRFFLVVDENAVRAQVLEVEVSLAKLHARVMGGHIPEWIGQHPIVVGRAADAAAVGTENDCAAITQMPPMIADDSQADRHDSPTGSL